MIPMLSDHCYLIMPDHKLKSLLLLHLQKMSQVLDQSLSKVEPISSWYIIL